MLGWKENNDNERRAAEAVMHTETPLLVIVGPGTARPGLSPTALHIYYRNAGSAINCQVRVEATLLPLAHFLGALS